jgi:hypothetical protein
MSRVRDRLFVVHKLTWIDRFRELFDFGLGVIAHFSQN